MNKEVNYVLQGSLLTLVVIGAIQFSNLLLSIKPPPETPNEPILVCGNAPVSSPDNPAVYKGKILFQDNCASCHTLFKDLTGPALLGVTQRITDKKLLYKWVRNPAAVLNSGNVYFNTLKKRFDNVQMYPFPALSNDDIDAIIAYIESTSSSRVLPAHE